MTARVTAGGAMGPGGERSRFAGEASRFVDEEVAYFDARVDEYLRDFHDATWTAYRRRVFRLLRRHWRPGGIVLDVGGGPAPSLPALAASAGRYVSLDRSGRSLGRLRAHGSGARPVRGDAASLPIAAASVDLVVFAGLLHHLPEPAEAVQEAWRVLRPGGLVVASEPSDYWTGRMDSPNERGFSAAELRGLLAGFRLLAFATGHHVELRGRVRWAARRLIGWGPRREALVARGIVALEAVLDHLGIRGADFVLVGAKPGEAAAR